MTTKFSGIQLVSLTKNKQIHNLNHVFITLQVKIVGKQVTRNFPASNVKFIK